MRWGSFETRVSGKWVLAGEHAVLRGAMALAIPHSDFNLFLRYTPAPQKGHEGRLFFDPPESESAVHGLFSILKSERDAAKQDFEMPQGSFSIQSTIPVGAGLGSSAAFCVALTRWVSGPCEISEDQYLATATRFEDQFHGRSSGMDVAAILAGRPILFTRQSGPAPLEVRKLPRFSFHDTGLRARTKDCVEQVERLRGQSPALGARIDEQMSVASRVAADGLKVFDQGEETQGLLDVARAMTQAQGCFRQWGLVPPEAEALEKALISKGALATKLTGAGGGGFIVALWDEAGFLSKPLL